MATPADDTRLPGILRLSAAIRRRIYRYAGVGPGYRAYGLVAPECYNLDGGNGRTRSETGYPTCPPGLLGSCRVIHAEAVALLYSANLFTIRYQPRRSLASLRALTPPALAHLATLRIVLNQVSCHDQKDGHEGYGDCCITRSRRIEGPRRISGCSNERHRQLHNLPLAQPDGSAVETLLKEWHATVASLAPHIFPGTLDLAVVCDVQPDDDGVEIARLLLASLRLLPRLRDCHIRLCGVRHMQLEALAHEAVLRARGMGSPSASPVDLPAPVANARSRLLLLPPELRLRILEYTDLITPWKEVYWSRGKRKYWISVIPCMPLEGRGDCPPEYHHGCRFIQCSVPEWPEPNIGCFCRHIHATSSSTCRCWEAPTPLFLICHTLYHDACVAFYTVNRFVVLDSSWPDSPMEWWPAGTYAHATFAASEFLRAVVPPHCLPYLRFLELVWAPFPRADWPQAPHAALREWAETVDWMRDQLNLPGLTLRLALPASAGWGHEEEFRKLTQAEGDAVLAGYWRILEPLERLGASREDGPGLARFYAEMAWPWRWASWDGENGEVSWNWPWIVSNEKQLNERAERFIMGARYKRGCAEPGLPAASVWPYSCERHC